ncbi:hypothetical protein [Microseira wollei]|uniref:Transposase n=1 Tax=Microseira wollei NIES-4236 TaxID=2530354 RepID=A0AAV3XIG4_9CYAN|nr:hypothetical protein [Microseira wollei]GET41376.1 hypothetical protein MiSe_61880 [Microseira wollei NIES-4236]
MSYQKQLSPWEIYRHLPNLQRRLIARFRRRNDAEAYLKVLRRMLPLAEFEIVYGASWDMSDMPPNAGANAPRCVAIPPGIKIQGLLGKVLSRGLGQHFSSLERTSAISPEIDFRAGYRFRENWISALPR